ncbi:MAG: hypothetical protein PWP37_1040 [Thermotogota bacterium]|uniref:helix-turn-helix transcriptional regulator n=1 Tax=Pseudothermotoga lettingae TaxID=177758 RepID=UPI00074955F9|nr:transcriptional regulator [Pseudothermotoga lettingae]KUK21558.1 MAG: Helix-turn-helix type 11 domain protein [Pseudothermotoga lettingae]MDK2864848.1 hypothetical protein [Thermotogota bacterium]HBT25284.1 hypothetical protein [Pseudothermotoga sp.]HCZ07024.1 hypothetical protein [Thermotogota bacterium]
MKRKDVENKTRRIFKLLQNLFAGEIVNTSEFACNEGISIRTVQRYIEQLREAGVPIVSIRGNVKLSQTMVRDIDYTLNLSSRHKKILLLMLKLASSYFGNLYMEDIKEIEERIDHSLRADPFYYHYAERTYYYVIMPPRREQINMKIIETLERSILSTQQVKIIYAHPQRSMKEYLVEPYIIVYSDDHWYLFCKDVERSFRTFLRISRMIHVELTNKSFSMPTFREINEMLQKVWGTHYSDREPVEIKILFSRAVAQKIRETVRHPSQRLESQPDGSVICTLKVSGYREVINWVLSWGKEAKLLEPEWMRKKMAEEIKSMHYKYKT